jgi:PadR family transcriptional regulator PadR
MRKGSTGLLLLHLLTAGPMYGFELAERLRTDTHGVLDFKEGTLYPALHRLEAEEFVESFWQASPTGPRRRYYRLTTAGRTALVERRGEWADWAKSPAAVGGANTSCNRIHQMVP